MKALITNFMIAANAGGIFDQINEKLEELVGKLQALSFWVAAVMLIVVLLSGMVDFEKADEVKRKCMRIFISFVLILAVTIVLQAVKGWAVF